MGSQGYDERDDASHAISTLSRSVAKMVVQREDLTQLEGIGKDGRRQGTC
jgi:hypothetical protein